MLADGKFERLAARSRKDVSSCLIEICTNTRILGVDDFPPCAIEQVQAIVRIAVNLLNKMVSLTLVGRKNNV